MMRVPLSGILGDLQINTSNLPPLQTTLVEANVNLDARASVLSELGSELVTTGSAVGVAQLGLPSSTASRLDTSAAPTPFDFSVDTESSVSADAVLTPFDFSGERGIVISSPISRFQCAVRKHHGNG